MAMSWKTAASCSKGRPTRCARTPTSRNSISASTKPAPANPTATSNTTSAANAGCRKRAGVLAGNALDRSGRPRDNCGARSFGAPLMSQTLPRIAVIGTGGTISSLGASSLDVLDYPDFGQKLSAEALLDRFAETRLVADPLPVTFRQVGSTDIGPKDWLELRALIHKTVRDDPEIAGFVIPHGTATLEETG